MPHSFTVNALVLASYNVGEADRFVILLTRERGRLAARVPGARRLKSRLAALLPLTHLSVELKEHGGCYFVAGSATQYDRLNPGGLNDFLMRTQGMELLLSLLSDEDPVPEIFDAAVQFLLASPDEPHRIIAFSFRLLHLLGVLPEWHDERFARLTPEEHAFITGNARGAIATPVPSGLKRLLALSQEMLAEHVTRALKAPAVAAACMG